MHLGAVATFFVCKKTGTEKMRKDIEYSEKLNRYVEYALDSGVKPIELFLRPIFDCYNGGAIAFEAIARVNSVLFGVLQPDEYLRGCSDEQTLNEFSLRAVEKAAAAQNELKAAQVPFKVIFVPVANSALHSSEIYADLKLALAKNGISAKESKLCLLFDCSVTDEESGALKSTFSDVRAAGVKIAVSGYGGSNFAIEKLLSVCPDYLFLDESVALLALDRQKRSALAPLINFAKSLGGEVIARGVRLDEELREFRSRECFGFVPDENYRGALEVDCELKTCASVAGRGL